MVQSRYVKGSAKGERGEGSAKDKVERVVLHLPAQPAGELPIAPVGDERPEGKQQPLPRVVIVEGLLVDRVGVREVVGLELLGIDDRLAAALHQIVAQKAQPRYERRLAVRVGDYEDTAGHATTREE